jgi:hypothetical protein
MVFRPVLGHVPKKARPGIYARIVEYPRGLVKFFGILGVENEDWLRASADVKLAREHCLCLAKT